MLNQYTNKAVFPWYNNLVMQFIVTSVHTDVRISGVLFNVTISNNNLLTLSTDVNYFASTHISLSYSILILDIKLAFMLLFGENIGTIFLVLFGIKKSQQTPKQQTS